jgi:predicted RecB family nuclease
VVVYHYSDFEMVKIATLAARTPDGPVGWAKSWDRATASRRSTAAAGFCDLWAVVKTHFFGAHGLGLKVVASEGAGFHWRDDDPGGLNSQRWFLDAIHAETADIAASARQRVLDYNEDDVIATARVRAWLRSH